MSQVLAIASNTIREARRHRIFYSIFFFALLIIGNSFIFTNLTVATNDRILRDVGTGAISFFGVLLAIFLGVGMVSREVDRRTVYTVVTKPIGRWAFIVGKFFGLSGVLIVTLGLMFLLLVGVLAVVPTHDPANMVTLTWFLVAQLAELAILVAFAILMSTFSSAAISTFCTVGLFVIGHLSSDLYFLGSRPENGVALQWISKVLFYALPNFERFNLSEPIAYNGAVDSGALGLSLAYGTLYVVGFLAAAIVIFERRDFR